MRSFLTYGLISLAGASALYACGDDDGGSTPNTGGTGGTAGQGGSAGNTSMSGAGGGGAGGLGGGGAGGAAVIPEPASNCAGCLQITVPIPATAIDAGQMISQAQANYAAAMTAAPFDLSGVTAVTWRIQALTLNANYFVQAAVQNGPPEDPGYLYGAAGNTRVPLTAPTFTAGGWADITLALPGPVSGADAGADAGGAVDAGADAGDAGGGPTLLTAFDKSKVRVVALNVGALAAAGAGLVSIEVDSLTLTGTSPNFTSRTFDTGADGLSLNTFYNFPPGSTLTAR